uniref:Uncharacterized protein n=1 Tax=Meloidogyne incognita TaxID=6306 RepID=A0A914M688_MELIC
MSRQDYSIIDYRPRWGSISGIFSRFPLKLKQVSGPILIIKILMYIFHLKI